MRGLLSAAPGPSAIRLIVGTHLLLLIQAALVLWSPASLGPALSALVTLVLVIAVSGLIAAIHGGTEPDTNRRWRRRHGH